MPLADPLDERLRQAMRRVLLATLPGVLASMWFFGWGVLLNLLLSGLTALAIEALILRLRRRPIKPDLGDGSALVSATLLALALPAYCPWWLTVTAVACALLFGKHLWGGVGSNPFNPAMLGYALVLMAFPQYMSQWPTTHGLGLMDGLRLVADMGQPPDGWAGATALDSLRVNTSLTIDELFASDPAFGRWGGHGVEWINLGFLAGGLFLLQQRIFTWHAPVGMLASLFTVSLLFWNGSGSDSHGSPLFHLLTGATMLGAFFIVTEPVSGAKAPFARLLFGVGAGLLVYVIRAWGGLPDGIAFAVLLMNLGVPALERFVEARQRRPLT
ncbi:RnfABCDGE type electron transport complex subunit D [Pseudomonas sp. D2-30]|uniref:RnfABCDGE type electron transport complex subunit D n=1 Tax=unclassified Pseudomonas TaxID=196821 RepID=UPI003DA8A1ED